MNKIYKLKNWYSIEDAARRLTETLGEKFLATDVLQLSVEGHLPLSWYTRGRKARMVAPVSRIYKKSDGISFNKLEEALTSSTGYAYAVILSLYPQSDEIISLEGPYRLEIEMMGWVKDWVLSLITNTGGEFTCLDGFLVRDKDENLWQMLDRLTDKDMSEARKLLEKKSPDILKKEIGNWDIKGGEHYFPSVELPDPSELGFQKADLEAFEARLDTTSSDVPKSLSTKERDTLLKIIVGMAVGGYRYDPNAIKSSTSKEIQDDLAERGISMDVDTIRNKLKEAADLLPSNIEEDKPKSVRPKPKSAITG